MQILSVEPVHDKTNKITCAPSKDSEQPGHTPRLIRVFAMLFWVAKDTMFLNADSEDSDQVGRMPRLIWVFAVRIGDFAGFVMLRLNLSLNLQRYMNIQCSIFYWKFIANK